MSKTAGAGSAEYVAISGFAIFALIMGVFSVVSLVASILLLVPLAGAIVSVAALRQIGRSYGTQGGSFLAGLGLVLSLVIGSYVVTREATEAQRTRRDREAISTLLQHLANTLREGQLDGAYSLFSPRFKERIGPAEYAARMRPWGSSATYGKLLTIKPGDRIDFQVDPQTKRRSARARMVLGVERGAAPDMIEAVFEISDGQWMVTNIPEVFQGQTPPPGAGSPPGGTGG
jgi:hypothetical protein